MLEGTAEMFVWLNITQTHSVNNMKSQFKKMFQCTDEDTWLTGQEAVN